MTKEERCKYFLEEVARNKSLNQMLESSPEMIEKCMDVVDKDDDFMLRLRNLLVNSGEKFSYKSKYEISLLNSILNHANYGSLEKLRSLCVEGGYSRINEIVEFLREETREEVYKFSISVYEKYVEIDTDRDSEKTLAIYKEMYNANCNLINDLLNVRNKEEYNKLINTLWRI